MADDADRAQIFEEQHRARAIEVARARSMDSPITENGKRVCLDCWLPIPKRRLIASPQAVRCIGCQTIEEARG